MTPSDQPGGDPAPETDQLPRADGAGGTETSGGSGNAESSRTAAERAEAIAVLDEPLDDKDLVEQIRRPGMSRSTKLLLGLLVAVLLVAIGLLVGRATAPDTGPGSSPDVVGAVESVVPGAGGSTQITVRAPDGGLVVLGATAGTSVSVPRPDGLGGLRAGEQVVVSAEVNQVGSLDATHVDVTGRR